MDIERYALYHDDLMTGLTFTAVGYGMQGTGAIGEQDPTGAPELLKIENTLDGDAGDLKERLGTTMAWTPEPGTIWVSDFDNGLTAQDALGEWLDVPHTGLGNMEGLSAPGDSGGPAFIVGQVAGVASYTASLSTSDFSPDIDEESNSSFGELAFWQKVPSYDSWIDQAMRTHYEDAPVSADEVRTTLVEQDEGTQLTYFLVKFHGTRTAGESLSVDYTTVDGTATAGEDYLACKGRLILYDDEYQAVIPVEVIGDTVAEQDEYFFLEISNPQGGTFADDQVTLTAQRTIVDNDIV